MVRLFAFIDSSSYLSVLFLVLFSYSDLGAFVNIGVQPSNCVITKLHLDKDRQALIARKTANKSKDKGKHEGLDTVPVAGQD